MKNLGHHEGLVHLLTALGFFIVATLLLLVPDSLTTNGALGIIAFFLGVHAVADLLVDGHNKIHYFSKKSK